MHTRYLASGLLSNCQLIRLASRGGRNRSSTRLPVLGRQLRKRGLAPAPFFISIGGRAVLVKRLPGIPRPIGGWPQVSRERNSPIEPRCTEVPVACCLALPCPDSPSIPRNTLPLLFPSVQLPAPNEPSPVPDPYSHQST